MNASRVQGSQNRSLITLIALPLFQTKYESILSWYFLHFFGFLHRPFCIFKGIFSPSPDRSAMKGVLQCQRTRHHAPFPLPSFPSSSPPFYFRAQNLTILHLLFFFFFALYFSGGAVSFCKRCFIKNVDKISLDLQQKIL